MGLEPTASGVTGRRYNQLNYDPEILSFSTGGRNRARTCDPRLVRPMLSQLSYPPGNGDHYLYTQVVIVNKKISFFFTRI